MTEEKIDREIIDDILLCKFERNFTEYRIEIIQIESMPYCPVDDLNDVQIYEGEILIITFRQSFKYKQTEYYNCVISCNQYTQNLREKKLKKFNLTITDKIENKLTEYLGFDQKLIYNNGDKLVRVFGGAIRDIIADKKINDIDILCGTKSCKYIESVLLREGWSFKESLNPKDLQSMYTDLHIINEPRTFTKGDHIVQLIRPSNGIQNYHQSYHELISNVDISICGVSFDGTNLYENWESAILHILNGVFMVNKNAKMYNERRVHHRIHKLTERGWKMIEDNDLKEIRDLKLESILSYKEFDGLIKEYEVKKFIKEPDELDSFFGF